MSKLVRLVDPGHAVVVAVGEDGRVTVGRDFRQHGDDVHEVPRGGGVVVKSENGQVWLSGPGLDRDMGLVGRLMYGPPAHVTVGGEALSREEVLAFRRDDEDRLPIDFDMSTMMPPVLAGQLFQWLLDRGADATLTQDR